MRRNTLVFCLLLTGALLLVPGAAAQKRPYIFDKAHSQINFVAEAMLVSAHGYFGTFDGDLQINRQDLEDSSLTLTIDANSINTRNEGRDRHLRSGDFFDVANNPNITFVSTKVTKVDDKNISIAGNMTIRGTTKPAVVPVQIAFLREGDGRFKGTFAISRKEFGITYDSRANPIEDMVTVQFDLHIVDKQMQEERMRQRQMQQQQQQQPPQKPPR